MLLHRVAEVAGGSVDRPLEARIAERLHLAAVATDEVMVMVSVGVEPLVPRNAVAGVDPLHETEIRERVERPVDACDPDRALRGAKAIEDLLRTEAAVLPGEETDDGLARTTASVAGVVEDAAHMLCPLHGRSVSSTR